MRENPYRSPAYDTIGETSVDQMTIVDPIANRTRLVLSFVSVVALLYFVAMFGSWTYGWMSGAPFPKDLHSQGMYVGAGICVVATVTVLCGLIRNRRRFTYIAGLVSMFSFATILILDVTH